MKTRFAKQRLMKTLKAEEVNGKAYKPIEEARGNIGIFIDHQGSEWLGLCLSPLSV